MNETSFPWDHIDSEAAGIMATVDWAATPLGPVSTWSRALCTVVDILVHSRNPMFLWWGPDLIQLYNDAYIPSFGVGKHPRAMGQPGPDCWREIWPIISPQIDDVMKRGLSSWNEDQLVPIWRNGQIEDVYWTYGYSPVRDDDGSVGGTLVVCTETTARVLSERRLRCARDFGQAIGGSHDVGELMAAASGALAAAADDIPIALICHRDCRGDAAACSFEGLEQRLGARLDAGPVWLADGELVDLGIRGWGRDAFAVPLMSSTEGRDGFVIYGLASSLPFDVPYREHLVDLTNRLARSRTRIELTRRRIAVEQERKNLLLQAPVATAVLMGPDHTFELANPLYCTIVGRAADELHGKAYFEAFPELKDTPVQRILDRVYERGEGFVTNEMMLPLFRRSDGTLDDAWFKFNLEPIRDDAGKVKGMMAVAVDISEQVRARQVVEQAHADREGLVAHLEAASRTKDEFLAMLGHELRNPLSPILTALHLMRLRGEEANLRERDMIERQVQHMVRLVDDLLDVSRITGGKIALKKERVELAAVVASAIELASPLLEQKRHGLTIDVPARGLVIEGDAVRLAQVVSNVLNNAAKYTDDEGTIEIGATREGDVAVLRIRDNGRGISKEMLPQVFELFSQERQNIDRAQGGLGLGLAIARNLVTMHGGSIEVHSEGVGSGTLLVLRVPSVEAPAAVMVRPDTVTPRAARAKVLIVDDNSDAADTLGDYVSALGHDVRVEYDAPSAINTAHEFAPDIALLDIGLPIMDGYELALRLKALPGTESLQLVAVTGYGQAADRERSHSIGFERHVVKPIDPNELAAVLVELGASRH